jgi:hypothetical protein
MPLNGQRLLGLGDPPTYVKRTETPLIQGIPGRYQKRESNRRVDAEMILC